MAENKNDILIKLKIETDKANAALKKTEVQIKKTIQSFKGLTKGSLDYQAAQARLASQQATYAQQSGKYNNSLKIQTAAQDSAVKQTNRLANASGGATTSVLELGRIVSDAPYGIRGMANNISQLASNMLFTSQQVDKTSGKVIGFSGVLKQMGKTFMGPLGVLFAIQAVVAAFDYFYGGATKAAGAGKEFELSAKDLSTTLRDLHGTQQDVNDKIDEYITLMMKKRAVAKEDAESNKEIARLDKVIDDAKAVIFNNDVERLGGAKRLTKEQIALANKTSNAQKEILDKAENDRVEEFKRVIKRQQEIEDLDKKMKAAEEGSLKSLKNLKKEKEKERELLSKTSDDYKRLTIAIDEYQKKIEAIEGRKGKKGSKLDLFDTPEELELKVKTTLNARQKLAKQTELIQLKTEESATLSMTKSEEAKTFIKEDYARRRLDITERYEEEAMVAKKKASIKSAQETHAEYSKKIDKDLAKFISGIKKEGKALTDAEQKEIDRMAAARKGAIGEGKPIAEEEEYTLEDGLNQYMELQSSMTSFLGGEYDRQLTIEQNKTNALNNELNQRLLNENLSKDERERIQLQIGQNDEKLRKKQEAIEKKRFKLNKAANIATASINTYLAASQIMADPSFVARPVARFVAMAATITTGLLNVAKIARTKFQSSAGSGGTIGAAAGSNGGEGESREFNFNLAGSTQSNQLTQSIAGQLNQPIQTYVVSSEITSQQQLDLSISNTASLG